MPTWKLSCSPPTSCGCLECSLRQSCGSTRSAMRARVQSTAQSLQIICRPTTQSYRRTASGGWRRGQCTDVFDVCWVFFPYLFPSICLWLSIRTVWFACMHMFGAFILSLSMPSFSHVRQPTSMCILTYANASYDLFGVRPSYRQLGCGSWIRKIGEIKRYLKAPHRS